MTTARSILRDLAAFSNLELPSCRHARLAFAYAKMCQWQITKKNTLGAMRCAKMAARCLARSLEEAAKAARAEVDAMETKQLETVSR